MDRCLARVPSNTAVDEPRENARLKVGQEPSYVICLSRVGRLVEENTQLLRVPASHLVSDSKGKMMG